MGNINSKSCSEGQTQFASTFENLTDMRMTRLQDDIISTLHQKCQEVNVPLQHLAVKLGALAKYAEEQAATSIINSLSPEITKARAANLSDAHPSTFGWIFRSKSFTTNVPDFCAWLRSDEKMFWILGQPGSGKSTLMKFIVNHARTRGNLQQWAKNSQIIIASAFLWNPGSELQSTVRGLLQSLLHDIFTQSRKLLPLICSSRFCGGPNRASPWSLGELLEAFRTMYAGGDCPRFCYFIDGLDELTNDHTETLLVLKELAMPKCVKICISSRPWKVFLNNLPHTPRLLLERHTSVDIFNYVHEVLVQNPLYAETFKYHSTYKDIPRQIIREAGGVFLWVKLVIGQLLRGLSNGDDVFKLKERLTYLSRNLGSFYENTFDRIDDFYAQETARTLLILACAEEPLPLLALALCNFGHRGRPEVTGELSSEDYVKKIYMTSMNRLDTRCQDLVSINLKSYKRGLRFRHTVEFLHGTVAEFTKTPHVRQKLTKAAGRDFDPRRSLLEGLLADITYRWGREQVRIGRSRRKMRHQQMETLISSFLKHVRLAEQLDMKTHPVLLEQFERVMMKDNAWTGHVGQEYLANESLLLPHVCQSVFGPARWYETHKSSLELAIAQNLSLYVSWKLNSQPYSRLAQSTRLPLLLMALRMSLPLDVTLPLSKEASPAMVKLLLQKGYDPNQKVAAFYPFSRERWKILDIFLLNLYHQKSVPSTAQYQILLLLLESGGKSLFSSWYILLDYAAAVEHRQHPRRKTIL